MGEGRGIYSVAMFQKKGHDAVVSFFLGSAAQKGGSTPFI